MLLCEPLCGVVTKRLLIADIFDPDEMRGRKAREIIFPEDVGLVAERQALAISNPDQTFMAEFRAPRASGELGWFESHGRAIIDEGGRVTGTVNIIREVSDRKAKELDLALAAETDPLTGLANRRSLLAAFDRSVPPAVVDRRANRDPALSAATTRNHLNVWVMTG